MNLRSVTWRALHRSGVSQLCSMLTAGRLQILCFHGVSFDDEHQFRGKLFMTPGLLERRLEWLKKHGYVVLRLDDAVERLRTGRIRRREIVITIDDGFHGVFALAAPLLLAHGMTATIYVTSYYVTHPNPIFRLAIQYMAWKSPRDTIDVTGLVPGPAGTLPTRGPLAMEALRGFYESIEARTSEEQRLLVAREFGSRARVDYDELRRSRILSLMSGDEIKSLHEQGFDIQLHTHRHRLPIDAAAIAQEIDDNRAALAPLTDRPLEHFCYPSGLWDPAQWPTLAALGIRTATTCVAGFNSRSTPLLGLRRYLDEQDVSMDEFAAEMLGVKDLYRRARNAMRFRSAPAHTPVRSPD